MSGHRTEQNTTILMPVALGFLFLIHTETQPSGADISSILGLQNAM